MAERIDPKNSWEIENKYNSGHGASPLCELIAEIDRELPTGPNLISERNEGKKSPEEHLTGQRQYIKFLLDEIVLGIPLTSALEIEQLSEVTPLPSLPQWMLGICNIRGEIISVVDLRGFFQMPLRSLKSETPLIVIRNKAQKTSLRVDKIMGLLSIDPSDPGMQANALTESKILPYTSGVFFSGNELIYLLDVEKLLTSERMNFFGEKQVNITNVRY
jgi:purine-binding chemotaxis protein CheW